MSNDRELLELAAKAAGILGEWSERGQCIVSLSCAGMPDLFWRPIESDGDALRLAVKIRLLVDVCNSYTGVCNEKVDPIEQDHGNDAFAATRRAIVRAAAEIGRSMP